MNIITENQGICEKNRFLYSHEYRDIKMEGAKIVGKKTGKIAKKTSFVFTRLS